MNRCQQRHGHAQPQNPAQRGKQRHVHVVKDKYLVAQHGKVVELGTHDELMALGGRYRTMFDLQAQRFNVPEEEGAAYDVLS